MIARVIRAEMHHIPAIVRNIREADREELLASSNRTPNEVLIQGLMISEMAWTGMVDGEPVCIFGVAPCETAGVGRPWMIGTKLLEKYQMVFLRRCKPRVVIMQCLFEVLENWVDARNTRAIQWLKWLGFSFSEPVPAGPFSLPFCRFDMRR